MRATTMRAMNPIRALLVLLAAALAAPAVAGDGSGLRPEIPKPLRGDSCVEDTDLMRRNHMDYLKHHRDEVMHQGVRTQKYSLKECLGCHVAPEDKARTAGQAEDGHFCQNCHEYAGVHLDCFQCHNTRPQEKPLAHPLVPREQALREMAERFKNETGTAQ